MLLVVTGDLDVMECRVVDRTRALERRAPSPEIDPLESFLSRGFSSEADRCTTSVAERFVTPAPWLDSDIKSVTTREPTMAAKKKAAKKAAKKTAKKAKKSAKKAGTRRMKRA
jgi:hypothetical protein